MPRQEIIPGLDLVALLAEGVAAAADAQDNKQAERLAALSCVHNAQNQAWKIYCADVIVPRQEIWLALTSHLRGTPLDSWKTENTARWKFVAQQRSAQLQSTVQFVTNLELTSHRYGEGREAKEHLAYPIIGRDCPDELLGVAAEGKRGKRHLPLGSLAVAHREEFVDTASYLEATVRATVLGTSQKPKEVYKVDLWTNDHDPEHRTFWADPEHAKHILEWPELDDPEALGKHLLANLADPKADANYRTLVNITAILDQSLPAPRET